MQTTTPSDKTVTQPPTLRKPVPLPPTSTKAGSQPQESMRSSLPQLQTKSTNLPQPPTSTRATLPKPPLTKDQVQPTITSSLSTPKKIPIPPTSVKKGAVQRPIAFSTEQDFSDSDQDNMGKLLTETRRGSRTAANIIQPDSKEEFRNESLQDLEKMITTRQSNAGRVVEETRRQKTMLDDIDLMSKSSSESEGDDRMDTLLNQVDNQKDRDSQKKLDNHRRQSRMAVNINDLVSQTTDLSTLNQITRRQSIRLENLPMPPTSNTNRQSTNLFEKTPTKSLPKPPISTTNKNLPKPPPTTKNKPPGIDDYFNESKPQDLFQDQDQMTEEEIKKARADKLRQAIEQQNKLKEYIAIQEQMKLSNMTPDEQLAALAEKKRIEAEKLAKSGQLQEFKTFEERLNSEVSQLKSEIAVLTIDIKKTNEKTQKYNEIKEQYQSLKNQIQNKNQQFNEELITAQKGLEQAKMQIDQEFPEVRSDSTIYKDYSTQLVNKQKLENSLLETNLAVTKQSMILSKLQQQLSEKTQDKDTLENQLIESHYEYVERQYRNQDKFIDKINKQKDQINSSTLLLTNLKSKHESGNTKLIQLKTHDNQLKSDLQNSNQELKVLKQVRLIKINLEIVNQQFEQSTQQILQQEKEDQQTLQNLNSEIQAISDFTIKQANENDLCSSAMPSIQNTLKEIKQKVYSHQVYFNDAEREFDLNNEKQIQTQTQLDQELSLKEQDAYNVYKQVTIRSSQFENQVQEIDFQISDQHKQISQIGRNMLQLQIFSNQLKDQNLLLVSQNETNKRSLKKAKKQLDLNTKQYQNQQTYTNENESHCFSSRTAQSLLKDKNLQSVAEAIKKHLDDAKREAQADAELKRLEQQKQQILADITEYNKQNSSLQLLNTKIQQILTDSNFSLETNIKEQKELENELQNYRDQIDQSAIISIQNQIETMQQSKKELVIQQNKLTDETKELQLIIQNTEIAESKIILEKLQALLESEKFELIKQSKPELLETDPDYNLKVSQLTDEIQQMESNLKNFKNNLAQVESNISANEISQMQRQRFLSKGNEKSLTIQEQNIKLRAEQLVIQQSSSVEQKQQQIELKTVQKTKENQLLIYLDETDSLIQSQTKEFQMHKDIKNTLNKLFMLQQSEANDQSIRSLQQKERVSQKLVLQNESERIIESVDQFISINSQEEKYLEQEKVKLIQTEQSIHDYNQQIANNQIEQTEQILSQMMLDLNSEQAQAKTLRMEQEALLATLMLSNPEYGNQVTHSLEQIEIQRKHLDLLSTQHSQIDFQIIEEYQLKYSFEKEQEVIQLRQLEAQNKDLKLWVAERNQTKDQNKQEIGLQNSNKQDDKQRHLEEYIKDVQDKLAKSDQELLCHQQIHITRQKFQNLNQIFKDLVNQQQAEQQQQLQTKEQILIEHDKVSAEFPVNQNVELQQTKSESIVIEGQINETQHTIQVTLSELAATQLHIEQKIQILLSNQNELLALETEQKSIVLIESNPEFDNLVTNLQEKIDSSKSFLDFITNQQAQLELQFEENKENQIQISQEIENEVHKHQLLFESQNQLQIIQHSNKTEQSQNLQETVMINEDVSAAIQNYKLECDQQIQEQNSQLQELQKPPVQQNKRRHNRNQSIIIANTFETNNSELTQTQDEVMNALYLDSQGQKVTILEEKPAIESNKLFEALTNKFVEDLSRLSIIDIKKHNSTRTGAGTFRATQYDRGKTILKQVKNHTEDSVLGDLLICLLSGKQIMMIHSDFEIMQGYQLFEQLFSADQTCHEALFGLGRINYIQGRYELAEKLFIKAYESKRDFVYRVWLGYSQFQLCKKLTAANPKKQVIAKNAFLNLDRCSKEARVGLYANFALIYLALDPEIRIKELKDPSVYQNLILEKDGKYEGQLASALINLKNSFEQLQELIELDGRPHAHLLTIRYLLSIKEFQKARIAAEYAYQKISDFESFQERLSVTFMLCKCLVLDNQPQKALIQLQMQYTESPLYSSILYQYGKTIVSQPALHKFLASGISALQEVKRISIQLRSAKASYWLSLAAKIQDKPTMQGLYLQEYVSGFQQVLKSGPIKNRTITNVDSSIQSQIIKVLEKPKVLIIQNNPLLLKPTQSLDEQKGEKPNIQELSDLCQNIKNKRDSRLYRAILCYRLTEDFYEANQIFQELLKQDDIEIKLENIKFIRYTLMHGSQFCDDPFDEARKLVIQVKNEFHDGELWSQCLIHAAKLMFEVAGDSLELKLEALQYLLEMKQCLPVIDILLADIKLPNLNRYISTGDQSLNCIDFQVQTSQIQQQVDESNEFKPQDEYDETNIFFMQSQFAQSKLKSSPLASLSVSEIKDHQRTKGDFLFYFGTAQTEIAQEIEENLAQTVKYYKSSTPLIAVLKYLQHFKRQNNQLVGDIEYNNINDYGFCVSSKYQFLYLIAKQCFKSGIYIDLAVQSLMEYLQFVIYYKNFDSEYQIKEIKAKILLGLILKKMSTQIELDSLVINQIREQVSLKIKTLQHPDIQKVIKLFQLL